MSLQLHGDLGASAVQPGSINADDLGATAEGVAAPMRILQIPAKATTSGTFIDFSPADGSGIPSWAKEITISIAGVSTNGSSQLLIKLGAGSILSAGYASSSATTDNAVATAGLTTSAGFLASGGTASVNTWHGNMHLSLSGATRWVENFSVGYASYPASTHGGGSVNLGGVLDRIRITTVNGTDVFDAGSVSIIVKG